MSRILKAALVVSLLALGPTATANADFGASGTMTVKLDRGLLRTLRSGGVRLRALKPAARRGNTVTLPVVEGGLERSGEGRLVVSGGIALSGRGHRVTLRRLALDTAFGGLLASVGRRRLTLAGVTGSSTEDRGFGAETSVRRLTLTRAGAGAVEAGLGRPGMLGGGRRLGSATATVSFDVLTLYGGQVQITLAQGFAAKLDALRISAKPLGDGSLAGTSPPAPVLTGIYGEAALDLSSGHLRSGDGFALTQLGTSRAVSLRAFEFDLEKHLVSARVRTDPAGTSKASTIATFEPSPVVRADPRTREISAPGIPLAVSADLAAALNQAFAAPGQFVAGEAFAAAAAGLETR